MTTIQPGKPLPGEDAQSCPLPLLGHHEEGGVQVGVPRRLFEGEYAADMEKSRFYDIAPDGRRFLMIKQPDVRSLNIVLNWFEELERLVPTD